MSALQNIRSWTFGLRSILCTIALRLLVLLLCFTIGTFVLIFIVDGVQVMTLAESDSVSLRTILHLTLYRAPELLLMLTPFNILLTSLCAYLSLSNRGELIGLQSLGWSPQSICVPLLIVCFLTGVLCASLEPFAQKLTHSVDQNALIQRSHTAAKNPLYWRAALTPKHALYLFVKSKQSLAHLQEHLSAPFTLYVFDQNGQFEELIEGTVLSHNRQGDWTYTGTRYTKDSTPEHVTSSPLIAGEHQPITWVTTHATYSLPWFQALYRLLNPKQLSLQDLSILELYRSLSQPFLFCVMGLLGAAYVFKPPRLRHTFFSVGCALLSGISLYLFNFIAYKLGTSQIISSGLAVILPIYFGGVSVLYAFSLNTSRT